MPYTKREIRRAMRIGGWWKYACDSTPSVAQYMVGLLSEKKTTRSNAFSFLEELIVNQGYLSNRAGYYVIPFIFKALCEDIPYGREELAELVTEIGLGQSPEGLMCRTYEGDIVPLTVACRAEIEKFKDLITSLCDDPNSKVASEMTVLLDAMSDWPEDNLKQYGWPRQQ